MTTLTAEKPPSCKQALGRGLSIALVLVAGLVAATAAALVAPALADALNPSALLEAAGLPAAAGTVASILATIVVVALGGLALLYAAAITAQALWPTLGVALIGGRGLNIAFIGLVYVGSVLVSVIALFAGLGAFFTWMVSHGLSIRAAEPLLVLGAVLAAIFIVAWAFAALSRRRLGGPLGLMQDIVRPGGIGSVIAVCLSIALAPLILAAAAVAAALSLAAAFAVAGVALLVMLAPLMFVMLAAACKD